ncbi:MAG: hypothetical protein K0M56_02185 [Kaistella sp.]|nr:hypothetical protein [Kaistella sp.]
MDSGRWAKSKRQLLPFALALVICGRHTAAEAVPSCVEPFDSGHLAKSRRQFFPFAFCLGSCHREEAHRRMEILPIEVLYTCRLILFSDKKKVPWKSLKNIFNGKYLLKHLFYWKLKAIFDGKSNSNGK